MDLQQRNRPATIAQRFRSLQQFFRWLVDEGEMDVSPMAKMKVPAVPLEPPPVLGEDDLRKLLDACRGPDFESRRDTAIIRMLLDTGMRRGELAGLLLAHIEFDKHDGGAAVVMGKGRRPRACPFGKKTAASLDRYLFARSRHNQLDDVGRARPVELRDLGHALALERGEQHQRLEMTECKEIAPECIEW